MSSLNAFLTLILRKSLKPGGFNVNNYTEIKQREKTLEGRMDELSFNDLAKRVSSEKVVLERVFTSFFSLRLLWASGCVKQ